MKDKFDILSAPLSPVDVEWRYGNAGKDGAKFSVLAYLTSRAVQERFDQAFTPMGWKSEFIEVTDGFLCTISVRSEETGEWVSKMDGAPRTDISPLKGGLSDALKRCAVQWSVGRDLYSLPKVWIEDTGKFIPAWAEKRLNDMILAFNEGKPMPPVVVLKKP